MSSKLRLGDIAFDDIHDDLIDETQSPRQKIKTKSKKKRAVPENYGIQRAQKRQNREFNEFR